jgi:hypothetical protein
MNTYPRRGAGSRRANRRKMYIVVTAAAAALTGLAIAGAADATSAAHRNPAGYPADKAARMQHEIDQVRSLPARHKPTEEQGRAAAAAADRNEPAPTAGINNAMHQGPFPATEFRVHNFYQGPVAGHWYLVFAGSRTDPATGADQAAIRILSLSPPGRLAHVGTFPAPAGMTNIRITAYAGTSLTIQADNGQLRTFNLQTLSYS